MLLVLPPVDAPIATGAPVLLAYEEQGATCALPARAKVAGTSADGIAVELGPIDHAVASWALGTGAVRLAARSEALPDCVGLPRVHELYAPPHGVALGLALPATAASVERTRGAASVGAPDTWVVYPDQTCVRPCHGELAFTHEGAPPTLFTVRNDAAVGPEPVPVHLPPGGGAVIRVHPGSAWHFPGPVEVVDLGESLLVLSATEIDMRSIGPLRQLTPEVASAEVKGRKLKVAGLAAGRTHVALDDGSGVPFLVRVVVP